MPVAVPGRGLRAPVLLAASLLLAVGCRSRVRIAGDLPFGPSDKAAIVAIVQGTDVALFAVNASGQPPVAQGLKSDSAVVYVLLYQRSLADLRLETGRLRQAAPGGDAVRVPAPDDALTADAADRKLGAWTEVTPLSSLPDAIANYALAPPDYEQCAKAGGCFVAGRDEGVCSVPCSDPSVPQAPAAPAVAADANPPIFTPCPASWMQVSAAAAGDPITCEPSAPPARVMCPLDQAQFFGDAACTPIGAACGAGEYSAALPSGRPILYVNAGAPPGSGDGSLAHPFGSASDALAAAAPGTVVALSRGRFSESLSVGSGVTVAGACVTETTIAPPPTGRGVEVVGEGAALQDLSIDTASAAGAVHAAGSGRSVRLDRLLLLNGADVALVVENGAAATGARVAVKNAVNAAIAVRRGAALDLEDLVVDGVRGSGLAVVSSTAAMIRRAVFQNLVQGTRNPGFALLADRGAVLAAEGIFVSGAEPYAVIAVNGGRMSLSDAFIQDTHAEGTTGAAIVASNGAGLTVSRAMVTHNPARGILIFNTGTTATVTDTIVRDTIPVSTSSVAFDSGLLIGFGARAHVKRMLVDRTPGVGIGLYRATGALEDVFVRDTREWNGTHGIPIAIEGASTATLARIAVDGGKFSGIQVGGDADQPKAYATDLAVRNIGLASQGGVYGVGVNLDKGRLRASRIHTEATDGSGLALAYSTARIEDLIVGTPSRIKAVNSAFVAGVSVVLSSSLTLARASVVRGSAAGFRIENSVAALSDLTETGTGFDDVGLAAFSSNTTVDRLAMDETTGDGTQGQPVLIFGGRARLRDLFIRGGGDSAMFVGQTATVALERVRFADNRKNALEVGDESTPSLVTASDLMVSNVAFNGGAVPTGIRVEGAKVTVERFSVSDILGFGAEVSFGGTLVLRDGSIANTQDAVGYRAPHYDELLFFDRVRYSRNQRNFLMETTAP